MKRLFLNILKLCIGCCVAVLLLEGCLRVIALSPTWRILPVVEVSLYGPHPKTGYTHRPNAKGIWKTENRVKVSISDVGIRSNGIVRNSSHLGKSPYRIGIVGDSMVEALQVADQNTFSARVEQILRSFGYNVEVFNLGLAGATPVVKLIRAEEFADALNLDRVYIIEDPYSLSTALSQKDDAMPYYRLDVSQKIVLKFPFLTSRGYQLKQSSIGHMIYFLIDHSLVVTALNNRLNKGIFDELSKTPNLKTVEQNIECRFEHFTLKEKNVPFLNAYLSELAQLQKNTEVQVFLTIYNLWDDCPDEEEVAFMGAMKDFSKRHRVPIWDLKTALIEGSKNNVSLKDLRGFGLNKGSGHLNDQGHALFSQSIVDHILSTPDLRPQ